MVHGTAGYRGVSRGWGSSVIYPYVTTGIWYNLSIPNSDALLKGFLGELCPAQSPNLILPDKSYAVCKEVQQMQRRTLILFNFLLILQCIPEQCCGEEMNWTAMTHPPKNCAPTYHPTQGCTVEHVVQLGKHARTWTHTHKSPDYPMNSHLSWSESCSTPWYRITCYCKTNLSSVSPDRGRMQGSRPAATAMCFSTCLPITPCLSSTG